ncbi:MAG: phosphodiesterase [Clostridiales bacterium]|nr:phosphodiesterase [Clostridiales bacterium]
MKWMIASDIHGSAYHCEKLVKRFCEEKADRLLLLGDILYHGPRNGLPADYNTMKVCEMLNGIKDCVLCVRGNCDAEIDQMVLDFPIMADYSVIDIGSRMIFATHGHLFNRDILPNLKKGDILLNGHFHVPDCVVYDDYIYMNPGSVSIPKENSPNSFMTFENNNFAWKNLEGETFKSFSL